MCSSDMESTDLQPCVVQLAETDPSCGNNRHYRDAQGEKGSEDKTCPASVGMIIMLQSEVLQNKKSSGDMTCPASVVMTIMLQSEVLQCKRGQHFMLLPPTDSWAARRLATICLAATS